MLNPDPKKNCTRCYHYYEIKGRKVCRSPHLEESMVNGKMEKIILQQYINNKYKEVGTRYERSYMGQCGPDGEHFELCVTRMVTKLWGWWGSLYDEDAFRYSITQRRAEKSVDRDTP